MEADDAAAAVPRWRYVLDELAHRIDAGYYFREGRRGQMGPVRAMAEELGVGVKTVQTALIVLEDRGVVRSRQGKAWFVVASNAARDVSPGQGPPDG